MISRISRNGIGLLDPGARRIGNAHRFSNAARPWVHHALFWAAVVAQGVALWSEWRGLAANERLLGEVDRRLAAAPESAEPAGA